MKKAMIIFAAVLLTSGMSLYAQPNKQNPEEMAQRMTDKMKTELSLTDDQAAKILAINQKFVEQGKGATPDERQKAMAQRNADIKAVLNTEQAAKWEQLQAEMKARMKAKTEGENPKQKDRQGAKPNDTSAPAEE